MNKLNILKRIGDFLDNIKDENENAPVAETEQTVEQTEEPKTEDVKAQDLLVGGFLPDGEYEIEGQIVVLKDGIIESVTPKVEEEPVEPAPEPEMSAETQLSAEDIKTQLQKEFSEHFEKQKKDFEAILSKLTEVKSSGLVQAPVETEKRVELKTAADIIMFNADQKRKDKNII
jgi:hypothetical protein